MSEKKKHYALLGLLFPASMFVGLGIGLALGGPGPGVLLGMGVGFLLMGLVRRRVEPVKARIPSSIFGYFVILLRAFMKSSCKYSFTAHFIHPIES